MNEAVPLLERVLERCKEARFTGIVRLRAREGVGEVWLLSGITDAFQFGVSTGDEAKDRMLRATEVKFEVSSRLPSPAGGFKKRFPLFGQLGEILAVDLMRYAEIHALTCELELESGKTKIKAIYDVGELKSVETNADSDKEVAKVIETPEGIYRFVLPHVILPEGTPMVDSIAPPPSEAPPESLSIRALVEARRAGTLDTRPEPAPDQATITAKAVLAVRRLSEPPVAARKAPAQAEAPAKIDADAEARRQAEEARRTAEAEEARRTAEAEEARRKAEAEEARRKAEAAEAQRKAEAEEARKKAEAEAEAERKAAEQAEAKRRAEAEAEAKQRAEAEAEAAAKREEEAQAEAERLQAEADARRRLAEAEMESAAEEPVSRKAAPIAKRKEREIEPASAPPEPRSPWPWVVVILVVIALAYFIWGRR